MVACGGAWNGPGSPLTALADVRPGARRAATRWRSPTGGVRWWRVAATPLDDGRMLYEITDETDHHDTDGSTTARWQLNRMEWISMRLVDLEPRRRQRPVLRGAHRGGRWLPDVPHDRHGLVAGLHVDDRERLVAALDRAIEERERFAVVARGYLDRARLLERVFEWRGEVLCDPRPTHRVLGIVRNITEHHRDRAELTFLAEDDPLTGVANRRRIGSRIADCAVGPRGGALLMIDIDNLEDINDLRGHVVGDLIIRRVAAAVAGQFGPDALLGRLGGDEFAVIVPGGTAPAALALASSSARRCRRDGGRTRPCT